MAGSGQLSPMYLDSSFLYATFNLIQGMAINGSNIFLSEFDGRKIRRLNQSSSMFKKQATTFPHLFPPDFTFSIGTGATASPALTGPDSDVSFGQLAEMVVDPISGALFVV